MQHEKTLFKAPSGAQLSFTRTGLWHGPLGQSLPRRTATRTLQATLEAAWKAGIRYYDTAPLYGLGSVGNATQAISCKGKKRSDYVISTKVGRVLEVCKPSERTGIGKFFDTPSRREKFDYSYDGFMRSLRIFL